MSSNVAQNDFKWLCFDTKKQKQRFPQVSGTTERLEGRMKSLEADLREEIK